jgi:predicted ester cyclase
VYELFDAWNAHDIDRACKCIDDTCNGGGPDGFRRELAAFLTAFPDLEITLEDHVSERDRVATRVTMSATHRGVLSGVAPTGRRVVMKANHIFRCAGGKIVQRHGQMDRLEVMVQLGMRLVPADSQEGGPK